MIETLTPFGVGSEYSCRRSGCWGGHFLVIGKSVRLGHVVLQEKTRRILLRDRSVRFGLQQAWLNPTRTCRLDRRPPCDASERVRLEPTLLHACRACSCRVAAAVLSAGALGATAQAEAAGVQAGADAFLVVAQPLDTQAKPLPGQAVNGEFHILSDVQTQLDRRGRTTFRRVASRALNGRGVEEIAHVGIDFDPCVPGALAAYAEPPSRRTRPGSPRHGQDQGPAARDRARVPHLRRRPDPRHLLDDVRPGDIVEFAYSVQGGNPVFGGREFGTFDVQWRSPVHRLHRRLRLPVGRDVIRFQAYLTDLRPTRQVKDGWIEYVWQADDVPPLPRQTGTPGWYVSYPGIRWSAFADWREVARWAEPFYAVPVHPGGALRAEVERIAAQAATPEQRTLAVLDFVQSQVRYLGIEIGPGSHAPRPPDKVLEQRFGDCKDKVRLAVTMLRALGVTAHAALVSTRLRQEAAAVLPSPDAFNHVVLRVQLFDQVFWLDPTRAPQRGGLTQLAQASFGKALVLDGQSDALVEMPEAVGAERRRDIAMRLDASAGFAHAPTLEVTTTFDGAAAESMRETLRNESTDELQREYLSYYRRSYPTLEIALKPMTVADDEAANRVVTTEFYRAESLWAKNLPGGKPVAYLSVPEMRSMLRRPDDVRLNRARLRGRPPRAAHGEHDRAVAGRPGDGAVVEHGRQPGLHVHGGERVRRSGRCAGHPATGAGPTTSRRASSPPTSPISTPRAAASATRCARSRRVRQSSPRRSQKGWRRGLCGSCFA